MPIGIGQIGAYAIENIQFVYRDRRYHTFLPEIREVVRAAE
jgi:hypothetical protein